MDNGYETVDKSQFGKLILISIPTKEAEEMVVSYLARKVTNVPAQKLARKIRKTPSVLSKDIVASKGERIAQNLRDLGAKAEFVPHEPRPRVFQVPSDEAPADDVEAVQVMSEHYQAPQQGRPQTSRVGKKLMTAVVVVILMAVFLLLSWQLYLLLIAKILR